MPVADEQLSPAQQETNRANFAMEVQAMVDAERARLRARGGPVASAQL